MTVGEVLDAVRDGAVLGDIRSEVQRKRDGLIPGAIFTVASPGMAGAMPRRDTTIGD